MSNATQRYNPHEIEPRWQARWAGPAWFHLDPPRHLFHFTASNLKRLLASVEFDCRSEHHFSLRQNPFGWIQSALNLVPWLPRNSLYALLHRRHDGPVRPPAVSFRKRIELHALLVLLSPAALLLSIAAGPLRLGGSEQVRLAVRANERVRRETVGAMWAQTRFWAGLSHLYETLCCPARSSPGSTGQRPLLNGGTPASSFLTTGPA